jgi:limonene-1,2-epoxide hydrolase
MDWNDYKALCDSPQVFSRWMLEQSIELLNDSPRLVDRLTRLLGGVPIDKPADHRGGALTDMFEVELVIDDARAIHRTVLEAVNIGRTTSGTKPRGLGGFAETWGEYVVYVERESAKMSQASNVVTSLIDAFNASDLERIMGHFTTDAVYHNIPVDAVSGLKAIREVVQGFMGMATKVDWELRNLAETADGVVLTERVDRFLINGKWLELPVMGTFEVAGGKIAAWRDYFDMNQFQSQLAR